MLTKLLSGVLKRPASQCRVCHSWPAQLVCEACVAQFAQPQARCRTCALPVPPQVSRCGACLTHSPPLDNCLAATGYAFPWSRMVGDFKFREQPALAHFFADLLKAAPWVEPALESADLLLPMPLSRQRLQERGYNQALLLARALNPVKTRANVLLRIHHTPPQHTLTRNERLESLDHSFAVDPLKAALVQGARLIVVDDVMTTGSSLHAAARVLKAAGAAHITGLVIARTE